jgi:uncharacterized protein (DUF362 family)
MADSRTTRREFLRAAAAAAGASSLAGLAGCPDPLALPPDDGFAATAIIKAPDYGGSVIEAVEQGLALVPPPDVEGKRVLLKPNFVDLPRDGRPVVTDPAVIVAAAEAFRRRGAAEVIVGEGPALQRDACEIIDAAGLTPLLDEHHLRFVDLNLDDPLPRPCDGSAIGADHVFLAATAAQADVLVSMPKLKTHHWAGASLSMKNLFGILPGTAYGWPRNRLHRVDLHAAVFAVNRVRTPDYCIVDGVVAMEGDGPIHGASRNVGVLIFGDNAPAVDATSARIMKLRPEAISYVRMAAGVLGPVNEANIEQRGESIATVAQPFEVVAHLSWIRA